jgi:Ca2+-binding EF-hand superfamily protein
VPQHLLDKIISKINHQNYSTVYWHEFLNSLTEEGINREIVADA